LTDGRALKRPKPTTGAQEVSFQLIDQFLNLILGAAI
jgi:hypothetical protein